MAKKRFIAGEEGCRFGTATKPTLDQLRIMNQSGANLDDVDTTRNALTAVISGSLYEQVLQEVMRLTGGSRDNLMKSCPTLPDLVRVRAKLPEKFVCYDELPQYPVGSTMTFCFRSAQDFLDKTAGTLMTGIVVSTRHAPASIVVRVKDESERGFRSYSIGLSEVVSIEAPKAEPSQE